MLIVVSVAAAVVGIVLAFRAYLPTEALAVRVRDRFVALYTVFSNKYWIDELYNATAVRWTYYGSQWLWRFWDTKVVDGFVNGVGLAFEGASSILRLFQTGFVGTYALFFSLGVLAVLLHFLRHKP